MTDLFYLIAICTLIIWCIIAIAFLVLFIVRNRNLKRFRLNLKPGLECFYYANATLYEITLQSVTDYDVVFLYNDNKNRHGVDVKQRIYPKNKFSFFIKLVD